MHRRKEKVMENNIRNNEWLKETGAIKKYGSEGIKRCVLTIKAKSVMRSNKNEKIRDHNKKDTKFDVTIPIHMLVHIGY